MATFQLRGKTKAGEIHKKDKGLNVGEELREKADPRVAAILLVLLIG